MDAHQCPTEKDGKTVKFCCAVPSYFFYGRGIVVYSGGGTATRYQIYKTYGDAISGWVDKSGSKFITVNANPVTID